MTTPPDAKMVLVPFDLLKQVLDRADEDNSRVEGEFACNAADHAEHDEVYARIQELRDAAGIPWED